MGDAWTQWTSHSIPFSHHAFSCLHSELLFKGAIPCVRAVPRGSARRSRKAERRARPNTAGAAAPLCRQPGWRSSRRLRGPLLPPAARTGTRGWAGLGRAGGRARRALRSRGPGRPRPGRSAARHQRGRRGSTAAQVSRAQRGNAGLHGWCVPVEFPGS